MSRARQTWVLPEAVRRALLLVAWAAFVGALARVVYGRPAMAWLDSRALTCGFWAVAVAASLFYGAFANRIFLVMPPVAVTGVWWVHQGWFNFVGSLAGWGALWALIPGPCLRGACEAQVTWSAATLAFVAFTGITGHLPFVFMNVASGIGAVLATFQKAIVKAAGL